MVLSHSEPKLIPSLPETTAGNTFDSDYGDDTKSGPISIKDLNITNQLSFQLSYNASSVESTSAGEFMNQVKSMIEDPDLALI